MNKIKSIILMALLIVSIFMILSPVSAATYNVYESDGWQVLHDTIQSAPSGSTIYVHAGTYYILDPIDINNYNNITIIGDSPFNTIIDATSSGGNGIYVSQNYITIKNITVRNAPLSGIYITDYGTIENCIAYGNRGASGFVSYDYGIFKNCLSYNNYVDGFEDHGYCTYINCTAVNNTRANGFGDSAGGTKVINCIAVGNADGFDIENVLNPSEITYSNAWNNTGNNYDEAPAGTGSISVDPKFVDGINTFYLSPSSPSVDKGSTSSAALGLYQGFTTRTDGIWDKGIVDMGFHYKSNRGPPSSLPIAKILEILKRNKEK